MRRTRKWEFVAQEAKRLAGLGLSQKDIASRLGVNVSSVSRWMKSGQLTRTDPKAKVVESVAGQTPGQWAATVRAAYDLDVTDEQLVGMAEAALLVSRDPMAPGSLRLQAMGRFQAIVKQLALVARAADAARPEPKRQTFAVQRRDSGDPRAFLTALK